MTDLKKILLLIVIVDVFIFCLRSEKGFIATDSFYHIAMSKAIMSGGDEIEYLPYTVYNGELPTRHILFQYLLSWITAFDAYWSVIIFLILMHLLIAFVYYELFGLLNINNRWFWVLLLIYGSPIFYLRLSVLRPISIAIFFYGIYQITIIKNKKYICSVVCVLFTLMYSAYWILLIHCVVMFLIESNRDNKHILYSTLAGVVIGYVLHPDFPRNITIEYDFIIGKILYGNNSILTIPDEWYFMDINTFITQFFTLIITLLLSLYLIICNKKDLKFLYDNSIIRVYSVLFIVWIVMSIMHFRYIDYWYPIAIIFVSILMNKVSFIMYLEDPNE